MSSRTPDMDDIDQALRELLSRERVPEGLADATMRRVGQARAAQDGGPESAGAPTLPGAAHAATGTSGTAGAPATRKSDAVGAAGAPARQAPSAPRSPRRRGRDVPGRGARGRGVTRRGLVGLAAACVAAVALGVGRVGLAAETAQVELGDAVRVELGLNRLDRVVRATSDDADAQGDVDALGLVGRDCADALAALTGDDALVSRLVEGGTLPVSVSGSSESQRDGVLGTCRAATQGLGCRAVCMEADADLRERAHQCGMGVYRYSLYRQLAEADPDVTAEECRGMSMRELREALAAARGSADGTAEGSDASDPSARSGPGTGASLGAGGGRGRGAGMGAGRGMGMGSGAGRGMSAGRGMGAGSGQGHAHGSGAQDDE
ncbi:MAG: hypothetical protein SOI26_04265 [Coriobacteriales bacterium]|jgi:hypothetical protein